MAGNRAGGLKARDKNLARNPNHYKEMGSKGGKALISKGFGRNPEKASKYGSQGGKRSRTGYRFIKEENGIMYYVHKKTGAPRKIEVKS